MTIDEINATLGIDVMAATEEQLRKRGKEFCREMSDCYEPGTLEHAAFTVLLFVL